MSDAPFDDGLARLSGIDPEGWGRLQGLSALAPGLPESILRFAFGDIYGRPGLEIKLRELVTVAGLAGMGTAQPQLQSHFAYALRLGWTKVELTEAMVQLAPFGGVPTAINGLLALQAAEAEADR